MELRGARAGRLRDGARRVVAVVSLAAAAVGPISAQSSAGGWSVVSARMVADLSAGDGSASVTLHYVLSGTPRGAPLPLGEPIALELLGFGEATAEEFALGDDSPIVLWPTVGSHRSAVVSAPDGVVGDVLPLELSYRVERAIEGDDVARRGRVPVLAGPSAPASGPGGGFEARLLLPAGWALTEGFPSGLASTEPGVWSVTLPVLPALLDFRLRTDGRRAIGFPLVVDLLMLAILGAFAVLGWRHLRERAA